MIKTESSIPHRWWDPRLQGSLFQSIYRRGDDSREGHLNRLELTLEERTTRECDIVESEIQRAWPNKERSGIRILDCPCGQGRHSLELARRGYQVTGVDLCPKAILTANDYRSKEPEGVQKQCVFRTGDMKDLNGIGTGYSVLINMFFSFGFFSEDSNKKTLQTFQSVLEPRGLLLIHTDVNPYQIESGEYGDRATRNLAHGAKLRIQENWTTTSRRLEGTWEITTQSGKTEAAQYSVRIYSTEELKYILQEVGFESFSQKPFDQSDGETDIKHAQEILYFARNA